MSLTLSLDLQAPNGVKYTQPTGLFINNEFVASSSGQSIVLIDPATEKEIAKMLRLADLIEQKRELFATIDVWDNGKSYKEAIEGDLVEAVGVIYTATSCILVQDGIYDKFIKNFLDTTKTVSKLGNQWDTSTYQGPLVSKAQYDRVLQYIDIGKKEGATVATGGEPTTVAGDKSGKGFWVASTVFTDVKPSMRIFREEIFGPVVVVLRFKTEEEAIALANDTIYGLGAAVFTTDLERAYCVAQEIEAGVKQSGIGRELGEAGLEAYTNIKAVHVNMGNRL
ncbi:aldehyde dehydrogenase aldh [Colletotrichum asianum]|uniref:Aldehyde dehydrogenase aldh n=1 Tax=Colletotrichum asianum TaxID=702518 RepID=A0A8H3W993_9PEZI|nr:aldehyde dehydrogenase aldh [Colletotrichum asianum]